MPTKEHIKSFIRQVRARQDERYMSAADKAKLDSINFDFERGTLTVVSNGVTLTFAAIKEGNSS